MKIILTDSLKACPVEEAKKILEEVQFVQIKPCEIESYSDKGNVYAIVGSRALVRKASDVRFPNCKFIQLFSTGYDDIDPSLFREKDIDLANAKSIYDETLAEYVLLMMLKYAKRFHKSIKNGMIRPLRNYHYITELEGKTVGIMGVGQIGSKIAKLLTGFNVRIVGYAYKTKEKPLFDKVYHKDTIRDFFGECDFVINTLPHSDQTIGLLDEEKFSMMKDTVVFINIGRESIYKKKALLRYFGSHREATAILDIFELIPNPFSKFHRLSNIYITPRIAAISKESDERLKFLILNNLKAYFEGNKPLYIIN